MSKIKVKNFGPIKTGLLEDNGWMDVRKVTVFIGNQGSGKSSVAKLISTFSWIEKALTRGDYEISYFTHKDRFRNAYCAYHRLENYFFDEKGQDIAEIEYAGSSFTMKYDKGNFSIKESNNGAYPLPQIMYVPAERNFISTVKSPKLLKLFSHGLVEFLTEFDAALAQINDRLPLPINNAMVEYDHRLNKINIKGDGYNVDLTEASSGFQSAVPLYLVSWYLSNSVKLQSESRKKGSADESIRFKQGVAEIWRNENLTEEQRRDALSVLSSKFKKTAFLNIVEEPEQNLFPSSQRHMLNSLLTFNNVNAGNKLILTTHSPYIISYLSVAIQGHSLKEKIKQRKNSAQHLSELHEIVPNNAVISGQNVVIYQLDEKDGSIKKLGSYEGIPSDQNYLNYSLAEGNRLFDSLLEIEQGL